MRSLPVRHASRRKKRSRRRIWRCWSSKMMQMQIQMQKSVKVTTLSPSSQDALKYHDQPLRAKRHSCLWDHA